MIGIKTGCSEIRAVQIVAALSIVYFYKRLNNLANRGGITGRLCRQAKSKNICSAAAPNWLFRIGQNLFRARCNVYKSVFRNVVASPEIGIS